MATMLGVLTCDAAVSPALLQRVLSEVTEHTFNAITVDGECSTNDCVALLANGASGVTIGESDCRCSRTRCTRCASSCRWRSCAAVRVRPSS